MTFRFEWAGALLATILIAGCFEPPRGGPRLKTFPVTGTVEVDGEPTEAIDVECHPEPGTSEINYPVTASTDKDGNFSLGMYQAGDGLPVGTYSLAFKWIEPGIGLKDRFKGAYADPKKSSHKLTVVLGEKNDLGTIELSTKAPAK